MTFGSKTLKEYFERGHSLHVICRGPGQSYLAPLDLAGCRHEATIELPSLIQRLGWDFDFNQKHWAVTAMLACSMCGQRFPYIHMEMNRPRLVPEDVREHVHGLMPHAGGSHARVAAVSSEESLQHSLELRRLSRERDKAYYEVTANLAPRRVRKFGRRR